LKGQLRPVEPKQLFSYDLWGHITSSLSLFLVEPGSDQDRNGNDDQHPYQQASQAMAESRDEMKPTSAEFMTVHHGCIAPGSFLIVRLELLSSEGAEQRDSGDRPRHAPYPGLVLEDLRHFCATVLPFDGTSAVVRTRQHFCRHCASSRGIFLCPLFNEMNE